MNDYQQARNLLALGFRENRAELENILGRNQNDSTGDRSFTPEKWIEFRDAISAAKLYIRCRATFFGPEGCDVHLTKEKL